MLHDDGFSFERPMGALKEQPSQPISKSRADVGGGKTQEFVCVLSNNNNNNNRIRVFSGVCMIG